MTKKMPTVLTNDGYSIEKTETVAVDELIERRRLGLNWFPTFNATIWDGANSEYKVFAEGEDSHKLLGCVKVQYLNNKYAYTSSVSGTTYDDEFGMIRAIGDCYP